MKKPIELMAVDKKSEIRQQAAETLNAPLEILQILALDEDLIVRGAVAENPAASVELIELLARDKERYVRICVIRNISTPLHVFEELANDKDKYVKKNMALFAPTVKSNTPQKGSVKKLNKEEVIEQVNAILNKIITENVDSIKSTTSFKVRTGYSYDKFFLDKIEGSFDESLQGLIHHILYTEGLYKHFLSNDQFKCCELIVKSEPESIYSTTGNSKKAEATQEILDDIYWDCITNVANKLNLHGFDVSQFSDYLS